MIRKSMRGINLKVFRRSYNVLGGTKPLVPVNRKQLYEETKDLERMPRHEKIKLEHVGKDYKVHNGRDFIKVGVREEMVGIPWGQFSFTRRRGPDSKPKPSKKKKL